LTRSGDGFFFHSNHQQPANICANTNITQSYLTKIVTVINTLQANATTNATLQQDKANSVAYLKNTANQALAISNCTAFVTGLKNAMSADAAVQQSRARLSASIEQQFRQAAANATGSNGSKNLYGDKHSSHHHF
jgi:hypothetical protein